MKTYHYYELDNMTAKSIKKIINLLKNLQRKYLLRLRGIDLTIKPTDWAIGLDDALIIEEEIRRHEQKGSIKVLEIGSGYSTVLITAILQKHFSAYQFHSIEADANWVSKVSQWLDAKGTHQTKLVHLEYEEQLQTFNVDNIVAITGGNFDFVLVDAPPDTNGEGVRLRTCEALIPFLNKRCTLLLHDTNRIDERFAYSSLKKYFLHSEMHSTDKGLGVFCNLKPEGILQ